MSYFVDTNVLLQIAQPHHPVHQDAVDVTLKVKGCGETLNVVPQNMVEYCYSFS
jgi:predicted nucleic acid-binding protein